MTLSLASLFTSVAAKQLARVDLPKRASHQHELNGSSRLRAFFGTRRTEGVLHWHLFREEEEPARDEGKYTFYDPRLKSFAETGRSEWRMYYSGEFPSRANAGDLLVLVRTTAGDVHAMIFEESSSWNRAAKVLFEVEDSLKFHIFNEETLDRRALEFVATHILGELGFELPSTPAHEAIAARELERGGERFPTSARMAELARELVAPDPNDADATLLQWLEAEERIFRAIEKVIVERRLASGFANVDEFVAYSLSVHNRRKSRMGLALQNHLAHLFRLNGIPFTAQAFTENRKKPDFLFPGEAAYRDLNYDANRLAMLAAKSSCKERWTQVLTEADRIPVKHLCTLETAISEAQTEEMARQGIVLVLPAALHATYSPRQRARLMTVQAFLEHVRAQIAESTAGFPIARDLFS
jgi:hypothetical protein